MNKRIRMMEKAFPSFHAKKYFATTDKTQIPLREFVLMLRKGEKNAGRNRNGVGAVSDV